MYLYFYYLKNIGSEYLLTQLYEFVTPPPLPFDELYILNILKFLGHLNIFFFN